MAKGQEAKQNVTNALIKTFGDDYIGEFDRKHYVWSKEDGQRVQVAISMTCPKVPIEVAAGVDAGGGDWDFSDNAPAAANIAVKNPEPAEITQDELDNIQELMQKLGL